jgi:acyl-CoA thioester hydrolase
MEELKDFPVRVTWPVAWGEMDAMGHLNNIYYFRFFETIRIRYLEEAGLTPLMAETGIGPILAETRCRFMRPVQYPDEVTVGAG